MKNLTLYILLLYYSITISTSDALTEKLNAVIFFANVDPSCAHIQENSCRLKELDLHEKTRVKHSLETLERSKNEEQNQKTSVHCKELLKEGLMSLTQYCHTVLDMKTAIASVTSKELTNDIQEPENSNSFRTARAIKAKFIKKKKHPVEETIPSVATSYKGEIKNVIRGPKHTEIFKIRPKRENQPERKSMIKNDGFEADNYPLVKRETKPRWDVLDVMAHVRYSFLGNIFNNGGSNEMETEENSNFGLEELGKIKKDHGLFEMVTSTLNTLQEEPKSGFLMVIFGGHLNDLNDDQSALIQSVKYVTENTDPNNTLLIVTGSCSDAEEPGKTELDSPENEVVHIGGHLDEHRRNAKRGVVIPVFAKGSHNF